MAKPKKPRVSRRAVSRLPSTWFLRGLLLKANTQTGRPSSQESTAAYVAEFNQLNHYSLDTTF